MEEPSQSAQSQLCRNGCGFYGSAQTDGMCSKCYKEKVQKSNNSGKKSPSSHSSMTVKSDMASSSAVTDKNNECSVSHGMASLATTDSHNGLHSMSTSTSATTVATNSIPLIPSGNSGASCSPARQDDLAESASTSTSSPAASGSEESPSKPKKSRCATCRKRVGLTGFSCRCGKIFCGIHRYSDKHNCDYDYKADAQANIRKENPVVVGEKIQKI